MIATTVGNVTIKDVTIAQAEDELAMLTVYANAGSGDEILYENIRFISAE